MLLFVFLLMFVLDISTSYLKIEPEPNMEAFQGRGLQPKHIIFKGILGVCLKACP